MFSTQTTARIGRLALAIALLLLLVLPGVAAAASQSFPDLIQLPTGFAPEGIATGRGTSFYTGSLNGQGIFSGDLRTGQGSTLVSDSTRVFTGMKVDQRSDQLFVSGATSGQGYVYDAATGAAIATVQLGPTTGSFINDVTLTRDAAYFTDSSAAALYKLPIDSGGRVALPATAQTIPLTGDWQQVPGPNVFNANGIAATPDGRYLIVVNTILGKLYRVDPATGFAKAIDLGGASVSNGDGILLHDSTLYVVRNTNNEIAVINMSEDFASGSVTRTITNSNFNVPTTIARFGDSLYAVNAKFGTPPAGTPYEVVKVKAED